ncbi:hypothetical protein J4438_01560 [Candidatus Woesearchaeota archaeon]|nr:hypothetical protein [Candidatus Woesearchaeota archaeon]
MKKGNLTGTQIIVATITIIIVFVISGFGSEAFAKIGDSLGFGVDLTPEELVAQEQAKSQVEDNLIRVIYSCQDKMKIGCFCTNNSLKLPNDYVLNFEVKDGTKFSLFNNKGGKVEDYNLNNVQLCIPDESWNLINLNVQAKDAGASLLFGSTNYLVYKSLDGKDVKKAIDPAYFIFKPSSGTICILDENSAKVREKDICS